ncbi:MAG: hypothetical protein ACK5LY_08280, partial [Lachnospirales bacterium]
KMSIYSFSKQNNFISANVIKVLNVLEITKKSQTVSSEVSLLVLDWIKYYFNDKQYGDWKKGIDTDSYNTKSIEEREKVILLKNFNKFARNWNV